MSVQHTLRILCGGIFLFPLTVSAAPDEASPESVGLSDEEVSRRREALTSWTFEPVAIEERAFLFHLDRHDGSFFLQDRQSRVKWYSAWGRRGFASVLLKREDQVDGEWLPLDRVESLSSPGKRVRFHATSDRGEAPSVLFELETLPGSAGISLRFEVAPEDRGRVRAVRLLDGALWISDTDRGGVALPAGMGEWVAADAPGDLHRRLSGRTASLPFLALVKAENPLLLRWHGEATDGEVEMTVEVKRRRVGGDSFPGNSGLFVSLEFNGQSGRVDLVPLGRGVLGVAEGPKAYREFLQRDLFGSLLRYKTGARPGLRKFLGAALLPLRVHEERSFAEVASLAERLYRDLEIDQAALVLRDWSGSVDGASDSTLLPASSRAGGNPGLEACARRLRDIGFILGLELDTAALALLGDAGSGPSPDAPSSFWVKALEGARREENFPALRELCRPELIFLNAPASASRSGPTFEARALLGTYLRDTFGLVGLNPGTAVDVPYASLLGGLLDTWTEQPGSPGAWPLFSVTFSQCVRLSSGALKTVEPEDSAAILAHLLVGEVPAYSIADGGATTLSGAMDPPGCFAGDDGWAAGKNLSHREVFFKNTYEVLSYVARQRFRYPLYSHRSLTPDGSVREAYFGVDMRIVVNFGPGNYEDEQGGFLLPPFGFIVRHPFLYAFHALRVNGLTYDRPAFFVVRSLEGKMYLRAEKVRIYHGFGPEKIWLGGKSFTVPRETVVKIW